MFRVRIIVSLSLCVNVLKTGRTPLYVAAYENHLEIVNRLLRCPKLNPNIQRTVWLCGAWCMVHGACSHSILADLFAADVPFLETVYFVRSLHLLLSCLAAE